MRIPVEDDCFVDNQVVLVQESYNLESMIKQLYKEYKHWRLQVSLKKTDYLVNLFARFKIFIQDDVKIKQVLILSC